MLISEKKAQSLSDARQLSVLLDSEACRLDIVCAVKKSMESKVRTLLNRPVICMIGKI